MKLTEPEIKEIPSIKIVSKRGKAPLKEISDNFTQIIGEIIGQIVRKNFDIPVLEIEVPPVTDSMRPTVQTRLEALVETVKARPGIKINKRRK